MLDLLVASDQSVSAIAGHFEMSRPAVSQHLRILLDVGLVSEQRVGRERRYHLVPMRLTPVRDWVQAFEQCGNQHGLKHQRHRGRGRR